MKKFEGFKDLVNKGFWFAIGLHPLSSKNIHIHIFSFLIEIYNIYENLKSCFFSQTCDVTIKVEK